MTEQQLGPLPGIPAQLTPEDRNRAEAGPATDPLPAGLPRLSVLGTGYLGATHAVCMAKLGFEVLGVDVDEAKVAALSAGRVPFHEPGLPELLRAMLPSGRMPFT